MRRKKKETDGRMDDRTKSMCSKNQIGDINKFFGYSEKKAFARY